MRLWFMVAVLLTGCTSSPAASEEVMAVEEAPGPVVVPVVFDAATYGDFCVWVDNMCTGAHLLSPVVYYTFDVPKNMTRAEFTVSWEPVGPTTEQLHLGVVRGSSMPQQVLGPSPISVTIEDLSPGVVDLYLWAPRPAGLPIQANEDQPWHLEGEYEYLA